MSRVEVAIVRGRRWIAPVVAVLMLGAGASVALAALGRPSAVPKPMVRPTSVGAHQTKRGKVLSAANGHTLYMFTSDTSRRSNCTGSCAAGWMPLLTSSRPVAIPGSGVNAGLLGTVARTNRALQVSYNGHPLYTFSKDTGAGQINGEGANKFGGHWYVVGLSGNAIKPKSGHVCHGLCQSY